MLLAGCDDAHESRMDALQAKCEERATRVVREFMSEMMRVGGIRTGVREIRSGVRIE